jgi:hypothetical protein
MKRLLVFGIPVVALAVAVGLYISSAESRNPRWKTTDVWYHASDVASLGSTGRPQLVEFFHPD